MNATTNTDKRDPSKVYGLDMPTIIAPGTDKVGALWAISAETGQDALEVRAARGRVVARATGGGLVFGGDANGRFRAFDDRTGKVLWETNLGAPVSGFPIRSRWTASSTCRWPQVRLGWPTRRCA